MNAYAYPEMTLMQGMSEHQRLVFLSQYNAIRKDVVTGVLLAVLLGHFGIHRFYMGEIGWGILYLFFCWTGIPTILGFIEAFLMPSRVHEYNVVHASILAAQVRHMPFGGADAPSNRGLVAV